MHQKYIQQFLSFYMLVFSKILIFALFSYLMGNRRQKNFLFKFHETFDDLLAYSAKDLTASSMRANGSTTGSTATA